MKILLPYTSTQAIMFLRGLITHVVTIVISLECQLCIWTCCKGYDILEFIIEYIVLIFYCNYGNHSMKNNALGNLNQYI